MSLLESFESAKEYRDKLRAIEQPVYNVARLFESPAPKVFFISDESEHSESENSDSTEIDEVTNATHSGSFDASMQSESQIPDSTEIDEAANAIRSDSFDESEIKKGNESQSIVLRESCDSDANNLSLALPSNSIYITSFSTVLVENEPNLSVHENSQRSEKDPLASIHLDASEEAAFDDIFDCANATDNEEQLQCESDLFSDTPNATSHDCNDQSGKLFCIALFQ